MFESPTLTFSQDDAMASSSIFCLASALKHFSGSNRPLRRNPLLMQLFCTHRIPQGYRIVENLQHGDIRFAADFETADAILPTDNAGGFNRALCDNLAEAQTHRQKLGQYRRQIADDTETRLTEAAMQVRADDIGDDALAHGALHKIEIKVAAGMADVKNHAALFGLANFRKQSALL